MSSRQSETHALPAALVEAWRADRSSPAERRHRYARFVKTQRRRRALPRTRYWVLGGVLLGVGLAQAASSMPRVWLGFEERVNTSPSAEGKQPRPRSAARMPAAALSVALAPVPSAVSTLELGRSAWSKSGAAGAAAAPSIVQEQWQRAARALRENDFARAEQALFDLERSPGGGERDAARLARAQLLAKHSRFAEAGVLLDDLRQHARSELVRRNARELLTSVARSGELDRSMEPNADTNQP